MQINSMTSRPRARFSSTGLFRLLFALAGLSFVSLPASAAVLSVPAQYTTIQAAINASSSGDTVLIADGTYTGPGNVDLDFGGKNITVTSQHGAVATIIDCGGSTSANHRGFYLHSGETSAVISGLTVQNGYMNGSAGGGGGIYATGVSVTVQGCIFTNDSASDGGGICNYSENKINLSVSTCTFVGDVAVGGSGGGIYNYIASGSNFAVTNCSFVNGTAFIGGGIANYSYSGATFVMTNCTLTGNSASNSGGGIYNTVYQNGSLTLTNDIVYGDTGGELSGASLTTSHCDVQGGYVGTGNINADPKFAAATGDLHLLANSPCLGAGTPSGAPTTIDGKTRPNPPSIGAYEAAPGTASATVALSSSLNPSTPGQQVTFNASLNAAGAAPTGSIIFSVDGAAAATVVLSGKSASYSLSTLTAGAHAVTAAYSGSTFYAPVISPVLTQTVTAVSTTTSLASNVNPSLAGQSVTFKATVAAAKGTPTGTVTFVVDGAAQTPVAVSSGAATYSTSSLTSAGQVSGTHSITAAYSGDTVFASSASASLTQIVNLPATATTVTSSLNPAKFGQQITFTAAVKGQIPVGTSGAPTGSVTFYATFTGTSQYLAFTPVTLTGGTAVLSTPSLNGGSFQITATYSGDAANAGSSSPALPQTVLPLATTTVLTSSMNPSIFGQSVTFTVNVAGSNSTTAPTGTVTLTVDGTAQPPVSLSNGYYASFAASNLSIGTHTLTAAYSGDINYASSTSAAFTQTVTAHTSPQYVSPTGSDSNPGTLAAPKLTIQAAINATLSGDTVIVADGMYTGPGDVDLDFGGRNITVMSVNGAAKTIIDCGGSANAGHRGFTLRSGETGAVISGLTIQNGNSTAGGGSGFFGGGIYASFASLTVQSCIFKNNTAGQGGGIYLAGYRSPLAVINCVFAGNTAGSGAAIYEYTDGGAGSLALTNCTITGNTAANLPGSTVPGCAIYINGGYPGTPPTGGTALTNDIIYGDTSGEIGGATVAATYCDIQGGYSGTGNISADPLFAALPADLHLQAGSPCAGAGTSAGAPALTLDGKTRPTPPSIGAYETGPVGTFADAVALTSSINPSAYGQAVTFTATVTGADLVPTGTIAFSVDGIVQTRVTLSAGKAAYTVSALTAGSHTVVASYSGNAHYAAASSLMLTQSVSLVGTTTGLSSSLNPSSYGQQVTLTAAVNGYSPTGTVTFSELANGGSVVLGTGTLSSGAATFSLSTLSAGSHQITAAYGGDAGNTQSSAPALTQIVKTASTATTLTSSPNPSVAGQAVSFMADVTASAGTPGGTVTFTVDNVAQTPVPLNMGYRPSYTTSALPVGKHNVTAAYSGDTNFMPSVSPVLTQVVNSRISPQYVSPSGNDSNSGTLAAPKLTIQAAINTTIDGDTVVVEDGTYTGPGNVDLDFGGRNITVTSQNGAATTNIDCGGSSAVYHRGFYLHSSETAAVISNLTIENGFEQSGGAVFSFNVGITIQSCLIKNNAAVVSGGGILNLSSGSSPMTVIGCTFTGNTSSGSGGGVANSNSGSGPMTVTGCTFSGNTAPGGAGSSAGSGGGISNYNSSTGSITIMKCTLTDNTASGSGSFGGGINNYNSGSSPILLVGCTLTGNTASTSTGASPTVGGGIYNYTSGGTIIVTNCTLTGNTASAVGGGLGNDNENGGAIVVTNCSITGNTAIYGGAAESSNNSGTVTFTNCTITFNGAATAGGGVYSPSSSGIPITLINDILCGDTGGEIGGASATATNCDIQGGYSGTSNINSDPLFVNSASDLHLLPGSPCLGAGTAAGAPATTIDGRARPNPPSIGAYEVFVAPTAVTVPTVSGTAGQTVTLSAALSNPSGAAVSGRTLGFSIDGTAVGTAVTGSSGTATLPYAVPAATPTGGHTIAVSFTGDATDSASSGVGTLTVAAAPAAVQINAGGGQTGTFAADTGFSGGNSYASSAAISISGVTNAAPQAVYQTERYGNFTYTVPNLTPGASYTLRLHFAEIYWQSAGQRLFNVTVNGSQVLTNFDIFAAAGGGNKAVVETFLVTADSLGRVTLVFTTLRDNAKLSGLEILPAPAPRTTLAQTNAGGGASGTFAADTGSSGGSTYATNAAIDTSGVTSPAPQAVYQTERYGNFTYTVPNLTPGASYTLRLHFAEIYWTSAGQRLFNVTVNGSQVLTNFDIFAASGGVNRALVETFAATADSSGRVSVGFTTVRDNAKLSGLELLK